METTQSETDLDLAIFTKELNANFIGEELRVLIMKQALRLVEMGQSIAVAAFETQHELRGIQQAIAGREAIIKNDQKDAARFIETDAILEGLRNRAKAFDAPLTQSNFLLQRINGEIDVRKAFLQGS